MDAMYEMLNISSALHANSSTLLGQTTAVSSTTTLGDDFIAYPWNSSSGSSVGGGGDGLTTVAQELLPNLTASVAEVATDWLSTFIATLTTDDNNSNSNSNNNSNNNYNNNNNIGNDNNNIDLERYTTTTSTFDNLIAAVKTTTTTTTTTTTKTTTTGNCSSAFNLCPTEYLNGHNVMDTVLATVTPTITTTTTTTSTPLMPTIINNNNSTMDDDFDWSQYSRCDARNPLFNCSRHEFVEYNFGPQRLPLYHVLMVTIIYGGIFITGVLGNVLVCVVIVRHPTMHSATNYYLFSLAVSDLLYLLFGLPAEIFLYWHQYPYLFGLPFCKIRAFISEASTYVSVLTIVAFSMERFLAICHPLHLYTMSGFKRAVRIIAALWIISFISALPFGLLTNIQYIDYPYDNSPIVESAFCTMMPKPDRFPWIEVSFCVFFVVPMILISILYACMGKQIRDSTTAQLGVQQGSMHRESSHSKSRKAVIRMLAAVVITFFICWLPFHIQRLWILYASKYDFFQEVNEWMFSITGFAYYVSCTINPILYNVMSHRYRVAFKDILCGKRRTVYFNYTFARDQSSFRETNSSTFDRVHSVRVRSIRHSTNLKDHNALTSNALWLKNADKQTQNEDSKPAALGTNLVVVVDNGGNVNGRPKVYTEHEAQEGLLRKDHETCI